MEESALSLGIKAELICRGRIFVPPGVRIPFPTSRSAAGPGAGSESVVVAFSGRRVKMEIDRKNPQALQLRKAGAGRYDILRNGEIFVSGIELVPTLCHAPGQAFVCLGRSCRMGCLFCTIDEYGKSDLSLQEAFDLVASSCRRSNTSAVAVTSGVQSTVDKQVDDIAAFVAKVKRELPELKVGAEPLVTTREQLVRLREAGADEVKVNLEAAREDIFRKVCPNRSWEVTLDSIGWACEIFGVGAVTSNIIVGFGEEDSDISEAVSMLAEMGSVANLRKLRLNDSNRPRLENTLGPLAFPDPNRLISLGRMHADILRVNGLSTKKFETMCFPCGSCDIVPGIDL